MIAHNRFSLKEKKKFRKIPERFLSYIGVNLRYLSNHETSHQCLDIWHIFSLHMHTVLE